MSAKNNPEYFVQGKKKEKKTYHMITHRNKKIKKQLPALLHLHLHRPTALKSGPTPDNQREVMCPQFGLAVGRVGVGVACACEYRAALDTRVEALFSEREAL